MNNINFTGRTNFPLAVETMTFLQDMIHRSANLALLGGDTYILSGCQTADLTVSSGIVVIEGEILTFTGGTLQEYVYIKEVKRKVEAQGYTFPDVYNERSVEFGYDDIKYKWSDFKRISTNKEFTDIIDNINTTIKKLSGLPIGATTDFAGKIDKIPSDFMPCDGRLLNREEYPELFDIIGHIWGGSGTSFALPLLAGRVTVGYDANDNDYNQIGKKGGAKQTILEIKNIPEHSHFYTSTNHNWDANGVSSKLGIKAVQDLARGADGNDNRTVLFQSSPVGEVNPEAINRSMPYTAMLKIIRVR